MHATIRRYEGVDTKRTEELSRKVIRDPGSRAAEARRLQRLLPDRVRRGRRELGGAVQELPSER